MIYWQKNDRRSIYGIYDRDKIYQQLRFFWQGAFKLSLAACSSRSSPFISGYLCPVGISAQESRRQESKKDENQSGSAGQSGKVQSGHRDGLAGGRMRIFLRVLFFALGISAAFSSSVWERRRREVS